MQREDFSKGLHGKTARISNGAYRGGGKIDRDENSFDTIITENEEVAELKQRYRKGELGDVEVKERLSQALNEFLAPIRTWRARYNDEPAIVEDILRRGNAKANSEARETLRHVRQAMGLAYSE